jgi:hypothetical protein
MNLEQFKQLEAKRKPTTYHPLGIAVADLDWVEACSTMVPKLLAVVEALKAVRDCEICSDCHDIAIKALAALERDE